MLEGSVYSTTFRISKIPSLIVSLPLLKNIGAEEVFPGFSEIVILPSPLILIDEKFILFIGCSLSEEINNDGVDILTEASRVTQEILLGKNAGAGYEAPFTELTNSSGVDTLVEATRVDTTRFGDTPPGTYSTPLIDDTKN